MPSSRRSVERDRRLPVAPLLLVLVVLIVVSAVVIFRGVGFLLDCFFSTVFVLFVGFILSSSHNCYG